MASLLQSVALESCHREHPRSSFNSINSIPRFFSSAPSPESALVDANYQANGSSASPTDSTRPLCPLEHAQLPDHAPRLTIPRHGYKVPSINADAYDLPALTYDPAETPEKSILSVTDDEDPTMERVRWRLASGFFAYFLLGWGDGVTGTVLPYFMKTFDVSFTLSSMLYVGSTIGFGLGTAIVESVIRYLGQFDLSSKHWSWIPKIGFSRQSSNPKSAVGFSPCQARLLIILVSSITHATFFIMMGSRSGYWTCFSAYTVAAFSRALLTASLNEYFAVVYRQSLGYAFGMWSFGGIVAPLVCQTAISRGIPWDKFYLGSLILSGMNTTFLVITFIPTAREFLQDRRVALSVVAGAKLSTPDTSKGEVEIQLPTEGGARNRSTLSWALSMPYQWHLCLFSFIYYGCEVTTQAFMVSYLLNARNAPKSAGYVTSGFWTGITIGRFVWGHYTTKLSYEKRKWVIEGCILQLYSRFVVIGLIMHILIWTVKSAIQNAFATSIVGLVYGPIFPAILTLANDILPVEVLMVSMALVSATSAFGAAVFPLITGILSTSNGIHILPYMTVALGSAISVLWAMFPSRIPRLSVLNLADR